MKRICFVLLLITLLSEFFAYAANKPSRGVVKTKEGSPLRVRLQPNSNAQILGRFADGASMDILDVKGDWYKVKGIGTDGKNVTGYSHSSYIRVTEKNGETINKKKASLNLMTVLMNVEPNKRGADIANQPLAEVRRKNALNVSDALSEVGKKSAQTLAMPQTEVGKKNASVVMNGN